ncbi:hypothetical protein [Aestuariimicrobium ganziense]|uniref:hypothetical protein n=1 Tax=Aestuariimicrobium ganziense TaxID=2773677 RepID=UPI0019426920|nr:hypothetical protein [Aestuariimicrobium ganziense]
MSTASLLDHLGIAEAGKVEALAGHHDEALRHYREALRLAVSQAAPEVFFRHYTQCVLESLERSGSYPEVIEYCQRADSHYAELENSRGFLTRLQRRDHGATLERLGVCQLKAGSTTDARASLERAVAVAGSPLPVAEALLGWLRRALRVDTRRIVALQDRHHYFSVRPDQVDPARATTLPDSLPPA